MSDTDAAVLISMFDRISVAIDAEREHLSELDGAIGDADHGITMSLGFQAVSAELSTLDPSTLSPHEVLSCAARAFLDAVGASVGPLYATGFLAAAKVLKEREQLDLQGQVAMLEAIANGIMTRGKGQRGDKTMLDTWLPAKDAARSAVERGCSASQMWSEVVSAGRAGAAGTKSMIAARGRAVRLGQRSIGHVDPGAASAVIMLDAMADVFSQGRV